jgi:transposase
VLETAAEPLDSMTWRAAQAVSADLAVIAAMSEQQFLAALRDQLCGLGGQKAWCRIALAIHAAASDPGGIAAECGAILERAAFTYQDWITALAALADVAARMVAVLGELDLTRLVTTILGLYAVGAAVILAETGDPARYDSPRAWGKMPTSRRRPMSLADTRGRTRNSGRGRPVLRTAAWRGELGRFAATGSTPPVWPA